MRDILVLYFSRTQRERTTNLDHLYSLGRYASDRVYYLNLAWPTVPSYLRAIDFDLVVFHTIFLWYRVDEPLWNRLQERCSWLIGRIGPTVAIPQDEHLHTDRLCAFFERFGVTHVLSCAAADQWPLMYRGLDLSRYAFSTVLPGYLSDETLALIEDKAAAGAPRTTDIAYRVGDPWPGLGSHGMLKTAVGRAFAERAPDAGLAADISMDPADAVLGDGWYDFLLRARWTIGVEGGASVLDADGSVAACTRALFTERPSASFADAEQACFPGRDGEIAYFAISPRHLEAAATRTGQALIEGYYSGVLEPGVHYVPVKADFSNVDEVLAIMADEPARAELVERAHRDLVASDRYSYRGFVRDLLERTIGPAPVADPSAAEPRSLRRARALDRFQSRLWPALWSVRSAAGRLLGQQRVGRVIRRVRGTMGEV
jgi:hypothetical protein